MYLDLRDSYGNLLNLGKHGVCVTVWYRMGYYTALGNYTGFANEYHYTGFYTPGALNFYGNG